MEKELFTIQLEATIMDAAEKIERNHARAVVVLKDKKVVGVCSQGDIIRLLLRGGDIYTMIEKIVQPSFLFLREKDFPMAYQLIRQHGVTIIPIIDNDFHLVDIVTLPAVLDWLKSSHE